MGDEQELARAAGPPYTIVGAGYNIAGQRWIEIRKRGGQRKRLLIHPAQNTPEVVAELIDHAVLSMRDGRIIDRY